MGDMLALVHASGSVPVFSDCWKRTAIAGANSVAHSFRTLFGILSGPEALLALIFMRR